MDKLFTPKQVGLALGVSESSVKRWCDSGRVQAARTAGGHRKVPLSAVVRLIRESGQEALHPEVLGLVTTNDRRPPGECCEEFYSMLLAGDEAASRDMVLGFFQRGSTIVELGDQLLGPVMRRIGDEWETEAIRVHHERRASEVVMSSLHSLRQWLPPAIDNAPLALCATALQDFSETPIRLVELVLRENGWNTAMAGSGLPLVEITAAIEARNPRLVCLSLTHLENADDYIEQHNTVFTDELMAGRKLVVGGGALDAAHAGQLRCDLHATRLADLEPLLDELSPKPSRP